MGDPFDEAFSLGGKSWDDDEALSTALEPGEKVVWKGEPTPSAMVSRSLGLSLIGLVPVAFALLLIASVAQAERSPVGKDCRPFESPSERVVFTCFAAAIMAYGIYMLAAPSRAHWRARRTAYMLTNRRALVFEPRLFGGRRVRAFTRESLMLMQCKERIDGSGDLVFDLRKDPSGWAQPVGFVGVDRVREIEGLLRRKLIDADRATDDRLQNATGVWRLRILLRCHTGLMTSMFLFMEASWLVIGLPKLAFHLFGVITGRLDISELDGSQVAVGLFVSAQLIWLAIVKLYPPKYRRLAIPFVIEINDDRTVTFRNWFQKQVVPVADVVSIRGKGWLAPYPVWTVVRHKQGAVYIVNDFPNFRGFASIMKALNPSIDVQNI